jgi:hypothetical protein
MIPTSYQLVFLLFLCMVVMFLVPIWMRRVRGAVKPKSPFFQLFCLFFFEMFLGISVFMAFFSSWYAYQVAALFLPGWVGVTVHSGFWDTSLTPRALFFLVSLFAFPFLVFSRIGLLAIRDVHQLCREQRELVLKHYNLKWWWKSL